ncbi:MFS transporter [Candidatus Sororendozoicomonas aggregata]|uniref:MFS transporter n=1 Tax=Candidatus Sororendozoicomonas aggregata TaxID=3073239 RepID=UPI002ED1E996
MTKKLLLGNSLVMYADLAVYVVYSLLIFDISESVPLSGAVFGAFVLPSLISPLFGNIIDNSNPKFLIAGSNAIVAILTTPLLFTENHTSIFFAYLSAAAHGLSYSLYSSAKARIVVNSYPYEKVGSINAKLNSTRELARIVSPLIGATIYSICGVFFFILTQLIILILSSLFFIRLPLMNYLLKEQTNFSSFKGIMDGVNYLVNHFTLRYFIITICISLLISGFYEVSLIQFINDLSLPSSFLGSLISIQGAGALIGSLLCIRFKTSDAMSLVTSGMLIQGLGMFLLQYDHLYPIYISCLLFGFGAPMVLIGMDTTSQTLTPFELQGRVNSAIGAITCLPLVISFLIAGAVIINIGRGYTSIILLLVSMVCAGCIGRIKNSFQSQQDFCNKIS